MPKDVAGVMHEFKHGQLHSGSSSGPLVKKRNQAIAIAMSEQPQQQQDSGGERASMAALKRRGRRG